MPKGVPKAKTEKATPTPETASKAQTVKVKREPVSKEDPFRRKNDGAIIWSIYRNGIQRWMTESQIYVSIQQGHDIEVPKGSPYVVPADLQNKENCRGCGR